MDRSALNKATSSDPDFPSSHVYKDFASKFSNRSDTQPAILLDATFSSVDVCKQLDDFLASRLTQTNPVAKQKTLRTIRRICEEGCSVELRRLLQRRSETVKQLLSYRGEVDPLRGDALNKAVRDEAGLTLKVIFSEGRNDRYSDTPSDRPSSAGSVSGRIQGFGSLPPAFSQPSPQPVSGIFKSVVGAISGGVGGVKNWGEKNHGNLSGGPGNFSRPDTSWRPPSIPDPPRFVSPLTILLGSPTTPPSQELFEQYLHAADLSGENSTAQEIISALKTAGGRSGDRQLVVLKILSAVEFFFAAGRDGFISELFKQGLSSEIDRFTEVGWSREVKIKAQYLKSQLRPNPVEIADLLDLSPKEEISRSSVDLLDLFDSADSTGSIKGSAFSFIKK